MLRAAVRLTRSSTRAPIVVNRFNSSLPFGYVYDTGMLRHDCPYDSTMAENPARMKLIHQRLEHKGLLQGAVQIPARPAADHELHRCVADSLLRDLAMLDDEGKCEEYCRDKEILWVSPASEQAARLAVGACIDLVTANHERRVGNSFALVRPPGHHAFGKTPQGYCLFNNAALAAKHAVEGLGMKRVAIVDFDYHAANGTHACFEPDDDRYMVVSTHAYHHGAFWPFEKQYSWQTEGNRVFLPFNAAQLTEGDVEAAFHHLICPILGEFSPDMIIVSAGFDAGYCDVMMDEGQAIKAHGYGHFARLLDGLCPSRVVGVLEGGYFPPQYTEAAEMFTRGLQGLPLPRLDYPVSVDPSMKEVLWHAMHHHQKRWSSIRDRLSRLRLFQAGCGLPEFEPQPQQFYGEASRRLWDRVKSSGACRTREWFEELGAEETSRLQHMIEQYTRDYDFSASCPPSEEFRLAQMSWEETTRVRAYVRDAPTVSYFINDLLDYVDGKKGNMMICDRQLEREKEEKGGGRAEEKTRCVARR